MRTAVLFYDGPKDPSPTKSAVYGHMVEFVADELDECGRIQFSTLSALLSEVEVKQFNVIVTTANLDRETALCLRGLGTVIILFGNPRGISDIVDIVIDPMRKDRRGLFCGPSFLLKQSLEQLPSVLVADELSMSTDELTQTVSANFAEFSIIDIVSLCRLLEWDSEFFGFPVVYVSALRLTPSIERQIRTFVASNNVRFIEYRCDCHDAVSVRTAEENAYTFVDVRMTFSRSITEYEARGPLAPLPEGISIRRALSDETDHVVPIAGNLYRDSRYYFDGNFDSDRLETFYGDWLKKAVLGTFDDFAMIVCDEDQPVGFCTLRQRPDNPRNAVIGLFGIAESHAGRGLALLLIEHVFCELRSLGVDSVDVVTQGRNYRAQRLYQRSGFTTKSVELWYHKWL